MRKTFFFIIFSFVLKPYFLFGQSPNVYVETTISKLKTYLTSHITEKAYLQLDKPFYAAGDTIYFKAYVTEGERHQLSNLSHVLHVDLINTQNKIDRSIQLQLDSGVASGDFALPDSLPSGNYRIRAYTQWMRNNNNFGFFERTIPVGSINKTDIPENLAVQPANKSVAKTDLQFFPEGGNLVYGIRSKLAFKAVDINGKGIDIKGIIVNQENKEICRFTSTHLGMGYVYIKPKQGENYKTIFTDANNKTDEINLPQPETKGLLLSIKNDSIPNASVSIEANDSCYLENKHKNYTLLIYSGGKIISMACLLDTPVIKLDILKRKLSTGLATITLFSPEGNPLCERLLFVQNYDQLSLAVNSGKTKYRTREKVSLNLHAVNRADSAAMGHFSVSVIDESKVIADDNDGNTILSNLLLTSEIKGSIEQPNYYFADTSIAARKNLDILLLTQGYRKFTWQDVLSKQQQITVYQPENGLQIKGKVTNLLGKPANKAEITLISGAGGPLLSAVTDKNGFFSFNNLVFIDTTRFVLSAVKTNGHNTTKISWLNKEDIPAVREQKQSVPIEIADTSMSAFLQNAKNDRMEAYKFGRGNGIILKEVKIHSKKIDDQYRTESFAGAGHADQVMHAEEIEKIGGPLSMSLDGRLRGVDFIGPQFHKIPFLKFLGTGPMLLVVDGHEVPPDNLDLFSPFDVETIEVLKNASANMYGMNGGNGVLVITTKRGGRNIKDVASIGVLPILPLGFYKAREFYSPKYANDTFITKQKDFRSTIYWKPEVKTDKQGNASLEYYNADGAGTYKVIVEGIDEKGNLGRQVFRYTVE